MNWGITISITTKSWMKNPTERWNAGLIGGGEAFKTGLDRDHYPPLDPDQKYKRTGNLADMASYTITEPGKIAEIGSAYYLAYVLFATRLWAGWPGKQEELITMIKEGFAEGIKNYV